MALDDLEEPAPELIQALTIGDPAVHGAGEVCQEVGPRSAGDHEGPVVLLALDVAPGGSGHQAPQLAAEERDLLGERPFEDRADLWVIRRARHTACPRFERMGRAACGTLLRRCCCSPKAPSPACQKKSLTSQPHCGCSWPTRVCGRTRLRCGRPARAARSARS